MAYKKGDYQKYHASPDKIAERQKRNRARADMVKKHGKAALRGKEVDHKDGNPNNNSKSNLQITSRHYNRVKQ